MAWTQYHQKKPQEAGPSAVSGADLEATLARLGVRQGGILLVHASLSALGFVLHGVETVLGALRRALGEQGTLLVPTFTGALTDPACWVAPALPAALLDEAKNAMPPFDPERTLPHRMGSLSLRVLFDPHSRRSHHPLASFAALGPRADELLAEHDLVDPFGPRSPLGRARALGGQVLLLGVDQRKNTALMHAHCLAGVPQVTERKGPFLTMSEGQRRWITPERFVECTEGYVRIEDELVTRGLVRVARVGDGTARLMEMASVIDLAQHLIRLRPERVSCRRPSCRQCSPAGC